MFKFLFLIVAMIQFVPVAQAGLGFCPNGHGISGMMSKVAWDEIVPIRIFGVTKIGGDEDTIPDDAYSDRTCRCEDASNLDVAARIGIPMALWLPSYILESTSEPYCLSTLEGTDLSRGSINRGGRQQNQQSSADNRHTDSFQHAHIYSYPVAQALDLIGDVNFTGATGGYTDLDVVFMSEVSPFWNDSELGMFSSPELALVSNPLAVLTCGAESMALFAGSKPIDSMWWCQGSWNGLFPATGHQRDVQSRVQAHYASQLKLFNSLHRQGFVRDSSGKEAMCGGSYIPNVQKTANRLQHFFPYPKKSLHWPGDPVIKNLDNRVEARHDTQASIAFRWADACTGLYE